MTTDAVTPPEDELLLSLSDVARRLGLSRASVILAAKAGALEIVGSDASKAGRPARLVRWSDATAWKDAKDEAAGARRSSDDERHDEREAGIPLPGTAIGMREAERKYGVDHSLISYWKRTGKIVVLRERTAEWERDALDERSIMLRAQEYHTKQRKRSGPPGDPNPSPSGRPQRSPLPETARRRPQRSSVRSGRRAPARSRGFTYAGLHDGEPSVVCDCCGAFYVWGTYSSESGREFPPRWRCLVDGSPGAAPDR